MDNDNKEPSSSPREHRAMDILIVDDNPINQVFFNAVIKKSGYTAAIADSGPAAIQQADCHRFRLILMDIRMPGMDGYQVVRHLRNRTGPNQATPVIAVSAESLRKSDAHLFDDFLIKPVSKQQLLEAVSRYVRRDPGHKSPGQPGANPIAEPPPAVAPPLPVAIDMERSLAATGQDARIARRLQAMLQKELPGQLQQLRDLNEAKKIMDLRELVHRMTGSASFCGATVLCQRLRDYSSVMKDPRSSPQDWHDALRAVEAAGQAVLRYFEENSPD